VDVVSAGNVLAEVNIYLGDYEPATCLDSLGTVTKILKLKAPRTASKEIGSKTRQLRYSQIPASVPEFPLIKEPFSNRLGCLGANVFVGQPRDSK